MRKRGCESCAETKTSLDYSYVHNLFASKWAEQREKVRSSISSSSTRNTEQQQKEAKNWKRTWEICAKNLAMPWNTVDDRCAMQWNTNFCITQFVTIVPSRVPLTSVTVILLSMKH